MRRCGCLLTNQAIPSAGGSVDALEYLHRGIKPRPPYAAVGPEGSPGHSVPRSRVFLGYFAHQRRCFREADGLASSSRFAPWSMRVLWGSSRESLTLCPNNDLLGGAVPLI
jgi:hypothetical protein